MALSDVVAAVTPVRTYRAGSLHGSATGFFYYYSGSLHLVTSRTVVLAGSMELVPDALHVRLHTDPDDMTQHEELIIPLQLNGEPAWQEHPTQADLVDMITLALDGEELELKFVLRAFSILDQVPRDMALPLGEDVLVVGYPEGMFDELHNLPIARSASIASVYPIPFQGQPLGVIDANLPASTAGAPVLTKGSSVIRNQDGQSTVVEKSENYLAGVHSARSPFASGASPGQSGVLNAMYYPWIIPEIISQRAR
ncbi:MAG: hypothetical protein ACKVVP_12955 [Chloroflexota bacterium]